MPLRKSDLIDIDFIDAQELNSDGYFVYLTTTIVSTNSSTKVITVNLPSDGEGLITGLDHPVETGDRVYLTGTSGADGYYIVNAVLTDTSFDVLDIINNSTGGNIHFMYPSGASKIGFDSAGLTITSSKNLQTAIQEIANNSITKVSHATLRQLIHFIDEGPGDGFISGAYKEVLPLAAAFPTSITWYTNFNKTQKIVEKLITLNSIKCPISITWNMYDVDGVSIIHTITDSITYINNIFESSRTRTIN